MIEDSCKLLEAQLKFRELNEEEWQLLKSFDASSKAGGNPSTLKKYICFIVEHYSAIEELFLKSNIDVGRVSLTYHVQSDVRGGSYTIPIEGVELSSKHGIPLKVMYYTPRK